MIEYEITFQDNDQKHTQTISKIIALHAVPILIKKDQSFVVYSYDEFYTKLKELKEGYEFIKKQIGQASVSYVSVKQFCEKKLPFLLNLTEEKIKNGIQGRVLVSPPSEDNYVDDWNEI